MIKNLPLPELNARDVYFNNLLCRKIDTINWQDNENTYHIHILKKKYSDSENDVCIEAFLGPEKFWLCCNKTQLQSALVDIIGASPIDKLPQTLLLAALTQKIKPWQKLIEAKSHHPLTLSKIAARKERLKVNTCLLFKTQNYEVTLDIQTKNYWLFELLPNKKTINLLIAFAVVLRIGHTDLNLAEVHDLRLGDVIFFDECLLKNNEGVLTINRVPTWKVSLQDNKATISEAVDIRAYQDITMKEDTQREKKNQTDEKSLETRKVDEKTASQQPQEQIEKSPVITKNHSDAGANNSRQNASSQNPPNNSANQQSEAPKKTPNKTVSNSAPTSTAQHKLTTNWEEENIEQIKKEISTEQITVRITFEIGQRDITLEELNAMQEGYVFELQKESASVVMKANGLKIGHCELVKVHDRLGARILHIKEVKNV